MLGVLHIYQQVYQHLPRIDIRDARFCPGYLSRFWQIFIRENLGTSTVVSAKLNSEIGAVSQ